MPENEQQDRMLSETVVKEAVGLGMKSPLRDSILEAVEEADGTSSGGRGSLPLAGALFGAGVALGFLAGRESPSLEDASLEDLDEPEIIDDVVEETSDAAEGITEMEPETDAGSEMGSDTEDGGSSSFPKLLLVLGVLGGIAFLRRRLASSEEEEEWEPIEEFEPATTADLDETAEEDEESEEDEEDEEDEELEAEADDEEEEE